MDTLELSGESYQSSKDSWKRNFAGYWEKIERTGFYEFMIFNGAPSIIAWTAKNGSFTQQIDFQLKDFSLEFQAIQIIATGLPNLSTPKMEPSIRRVEAEEVHRKDKNGKDIKVKMWWEESDKSLCTEVFNFFSKMTTDVKRYIDEADLLNIQVTNTKDNGSSASFTCILRRKV